MKNTTMHTLVCWLLFSTVTSSYIHASTGLSIDDGSFDVPETQRMLLQTFIEADEATVFIEQEHLTHEHEAFEKQKREFEAQKAVEQSATEEMYPIVRSTISVPEIAHGYEAIYQRFIGGKLIYKPDPNSDAGKIEMPFADLLNPLEGTFDLSRCGDAGQFFSISTGYRKEMKAENANKLEVWIVPKFVVEKELDTTSGHYRDIMRAWTCPVALFWTWGGWSEVESYGYLTSKQFEEISSESLYNNWWGCRATPALNRRWGDPRERRYDERCISTRRHMTREREKYFCFQF